MNYKPIRIEMRRLFVVICVAFVSVGSWAQNPTMGDVNRDGGISITDVLLCVDHILGGNPANFSISLADLNNDDDVTITDVLAIVDLILNGGNGIGDTSQAYLTCPDDNHPHMIDLGLPSGTKWACCNVGANKPEASGGHYSWGETEEKSLYNFVTYKYCTGVDSDNNGIYEDWHDDTKVYGVWQYLGDDIAGTQYDVAHANWGGSWVMPSVYQQQELIAYCTSEFVDVNGVKGMRFTGENGGTIFLPAAGRRYQNALVSNEDGFYWSSTHIPTYTYRAYYLYLGSGSASLAGYYRLYGKSVRPVYK